MNINTSHFVITGGARGIGLAVAIQTDVTKPDDNTRATEEATAAHGNIDVWVNNAGLARHE